MSEKDSRQQAADRRKDYVRALETERAGCVTQGKESRVAAIDAELERVKKNASRLGSDGRTTKVEAKAKA